MAIDMSEEIFRRKFKKLILESYEQALQTNFAY